MNKIDRILPHHEHRTLLFALCFILFSPVLAQVNSAQFAKKTSARSSAFSPAMQCRVAAAALTTNVSPLNTSVHSFASLDSNLAVTLTAPATRLSCSASRSKTRTLGRYMERDRRPARFRSTPKVIMLSAHLDHLGVNEALPGATRSSTALTTTLQVVWPCWSWRAFLPPANDRNARSTLSASAVKNGGLGSEYFMRIRRFR
jgi:hypothetical protein